MVCRRQTIQEGPLLGNGFTPIVTEHFVVLARPDALTVLSNTTGAFLYDMTATIECRCIATSTAATAATSHDDTIWIGQTDGRIVSYEVTPTALVQQRSVRLADGACSVEALVLTGDEDKHVYALLFEPRKLKDDPSKSSSEQGQYILRHFQQSSTRETEDTSSKEEDWTGSSAQLESFLGDTPSATSHRSHVLAGSEHGIAWSRISSRKTMLRLFNHDDGLLDLTSAFHRHRITALTCHVTDVAVGLDQGVVQRFQDVWSLPFGDRQRGKQLERQQKLLLSSRIVRRLHWHAHAVSSVAMDGAGRLHSAGEESVWVTWDGTGDTPIHMLPRICVGPIDHLVLHNMDSVMMVYCRTENSIRAYEMHNKRILWKHAGFSSPSFSPPDDDGSNIAITTDPAKKTIMFSGTPGKLCHFSPDQRRVVNEWMVCPYNHVSRTDTAEIPRPSITAVAHYSRDRWLTSHVSPTEAGPPVCTLQFWKQDDGRQQKTVVAAMSHPHGKLDPIQRLALHDRLAVTVGKHDFRMWSCSEESGWTCSTKVTIPSGYSNLEKGSNPVFSTDGSVLALSFGRFVTLWNADPSSITFLSSIPMEKTVRHITFCSSLRLVDMLLISTEDCVSLRSVAGTEWWRHEAPQIDHVVFAPEHEFVCIAQRGADDDDHNRSSIVVLDARTGHEEDCLTDRSLDQGRTIASIGVIEDEMDEVDVWAGDPHPTAAEKLETLQVLAATRDGRLLQFHHTATETSDNQHPKTLGSSTNRISNDAPRLPALERQTKKRRIMTVAELGDVSMTMIKPLVQEDEDVPLLRGAFVSAFVGRNILRRKIQ